MHKLLNFLHKQNNLVPKVRDLLVQNNKHYLLFCVLHFFNDLVLRTELHHEVTLPVFDQEEIVLAKTHVYFKVVFVLCNTKVPEVDLAYAAETL